MFNAKTELTPRQLPPRRNGKETDAHRDKAGDGSECQSFRSCLPSDQAVVIQKGFVGGNFFLRIKIETEVATNEQQIFRINFLYILEMFASVLNSQEAIVFRQSLAQKCS